MDVHTQENRIFRFGMVSDNHLSYAEPFMEWNTRLAFGLFKALNVQIILDAGDITDCWQPEQLAIFRRIFEEIFPDDGSRPDILWIPAGHDCSGAADRMAAYQTAVDILKTGSLTRRTAFFGYPFVSFTQFLDYDELEADIRKAEQDFPDKPVFVMTHTPAKNAVYHSLYGDSRMREVLNRHPRVIHLSGHSHTPVFNERSIWQGEFTAINAGSLTYWKDDPCGHEGRKHPSGDALVLDVFEHKLVVHRYNVQSGREYHPDAPWTVPLPFVPETAPYRLEARTRDVVVPEFPDGARAVWQADGEAFLDSAIVFPRVVQDDALHKYRLRIQERQADGRMALVSTMDFFNDGWPRVQTASFSCHLPVGLLKGNGEYHVSVTPMNVFDGAGKSLELDFRTRESAATALPFEGWDGITSMDGSALDAQGVFETTASNAGACIWLKPEAVEATKTCRRLAAVIELSYEHDQEGAALVAFGDKNDYRRHFLQHGPVERERHVFELSHLTGSRYSLRIQMGSFGRYAVHSLRYIQF